MKQSHILAAFCAALSLAACEEDPAVLAQKQSALATQAEELINRGDAKFALALIDDAPEKVRGSPVVAAAYEWAKTEATKQEAERVRKEQAGKLQNAIDELNEMSAADISSPESIQTALRTFDEAEAALRSDSENRADDGEKKRRLRALLSSKQSSLFPAMRRAYSKHLDGTLWENDVDVEVYGSGSKNIRFIAGMFAANRNIAAAYEAGSPLMRRLRFDRVRYEWYRGSEYTYYDLETPPDSKID
jgi:hypothetical protein